MKRGSLHARSFRRIHVSVLHTDERKMVLRARKVPGAFEKRAPGLKKDKGLDFWATRIFIWRNFLCLLEVLWIKMEKKFIYPRSWSEIKVHCTASTNVLTALLGDTWPLWIICLWIWPVDTTKEKRKGFFVMPRSESIYLQSNNSLIL